MSVGTHDVSFTDRQHRLDEALQETDLQGVALNAGPSLTYLTLSDSCQ